MVEQNSRCKRRISDSDETFEEFTSLMKKSAGFFLLSDVFCFIDQYFRFSDDKFSTLLDIDVGNVVVSGTVDGVDIATRDGNLTTAEATLADIPVGNLALYTRNNCLLPDIYKKYHLKYHNLKGVHRY